LASERNAVLPAGLIALFFGAHVLLAYSMNVGYSFRASKMGTVHLLATLIIGALVAARGKREYAAYAAAYVAGVEVMWRMGRISIFYEIGKYALVLMCIIGLMRARNLRLKWPAVVGFLLLLPSAAITVSQLSLDMARMSLSFNLSGPLALAAAVCFFSTLKLTRRQVCIMLIVYMGASVGVMSLAMIRLARFSQWITFTAASNNLTSGGFGPNQVSAVLGLGCLCGFLCLLLTERVNMRVWTVLFLATAALAGQSAMTFSRGGLYCAAGSALLAAITLMPRPKLSKRIVVFGAVGFLLAMFVIIPRLDRFTQGTLTTRFQSVESTNRDVLVLDELKIWLKSPLFGIGVGMVPFSRSLIDGEVAAHTEFTRLLAEHGLLGAANILILVVIAVRAIKGAGSREERALRLAAISWSVLFMMINGMRIAAPSFMFGLACVSLIPNVAPALSRRVVSLRPQPRVLVTRFSN
jgi:hypothetical protein